MDASENLPTINRDLALALAQIKVAKRFARADAPRAAWYHMDLAEAHLHGLAGLVGSGAEAGIVRWAEEQAEASILPK